MFSTLYIKYNCYIVRRRSKGQSQEHEDAHHAVGYGIAHLLAKCGDIDFSHSFRLSGKIVINF